MIAVADPAVAAPRRLTINELTTVAASYSLSRFLAGDAITGPAPGLPNAAATVPRLVRPRSGAVGRAVASSPHGPRPRPCRPCGRWRRSSAVWVANNWARLPPTVGGDGLVEFIGAAAPVTTPLIGLPQEP